MSLDEAVATVEWLKSDVEIAGLLLNRMEKAMKADGAPPLAEFCHLGTRLALLVADNEMDRGESYCRLWREAEHTIVEREGGTPCLPRCPSRYSDF